MAFFGPCSRLRPASVTDSAGSGGRPDLSGGAPTGLRAVQLGRLKHTHTQSENGYNISFYTPKRQNTTDKTLTLGYGFN